MIRRREKAALGAYDDFDLSKEQEETDAIRGYSTVKIVNGVMIQVGNKNTGIANVMSINKKRANTASPTTPTEKNKTFPAFNTKTEES